jgi:hypothetical protein
VVIQPLYIFFLTTDSHFEFKVISFSVSLQTMVDFLSSQEGFKFTYQWYRSTEVDLNKLCTMVSSDNALHLSRTSFVQNRPTTRIKIR